MLLQHVMITTPLRQQQHKTKTQRAHITFIIARHRIVARRGVVVVVVMMMISATIRFAIQPSYITLVCVFISLYKLFIFMNNNVVIFVQRM